ncbi:MAG: AzlC family ABC transporter permease [Treponema sp.]|nr:AzlC family ABC transporter permease [Treponema sp.]
MKKNYFLKALKISLPVLFGYLAIGIAFGLMLVKAGYPWWLAPIMSLTMYAGAGQYIAVGLFSAGIPLFMILITEALVNIRHIVYGLSLISKFKECRKWKYYMIFGLTDETYSLLTTTDAPEDSDKGKFYFTIAILDHSYWILGSIIGAVAGALIPFDFAGVDFALTALFVVLLIDQIEKSHDIIPPIAGFAGTLAAIILWRFGLLKDSNNILLIGLTVGIGLISAIKFPQEQKKRKEISQAKKQEIKTE